VPAIHEACQVWIEQRLQEELEAKGQKKSLRQIGRELAEEIERVFETRVNPETLRTKARKMSGGSTNPPKENPTISTTKEEQVPRGAAGLKGPPKESPSHTTVDGVRVELVDGRKVFTAEVA